MHVVTLYSSQARASRLTATFFSLGLMFLSLLIGCGADSGGISIATAPSGGGSGAGGGTPASATTSVSLAWNPVPDSSVYAYFVHYGKQTTGQAGSCNYTYSTFVGSPSATITGLDPNTQYYFSVSAYNGLESTCSNEVSTVTPSAA